MKYDDTVIRDYGYKSYMEMRGTENDPIQALLQQEDNTVQYGSKRQIIPEIRIFVYPYTNYKQLIYLQNFAMSNTEFILFIKKLNSRQTSDSDGMNSYGEGSRILGLSTTIDNKISVIVKDSFGAYKYGDIYAVIDDVNEKCKYKHTDGTMDTDFVMPPEVLKILDIMPLDSTAFIYNFPDDIEINEMVDGLVSHCDVLIDVGKLRIFSGINQQAEQTEAQKQELTFKNVPAEMIDHIIDWKNKWLHILESKQNRNIKKKIRGSDALPQIYITDEKNNICNDRLYAYGIAVDSKPHKGLSRGIVYARINCDFIVNFLTPTKDAVDGKKAIAELRTIVCRDLSNFFGDSTSDNTQDQDTLNFATWFNAIFKPDTPPQPKTHKYMCKKCSTINVLKDGEDIICSKCGSRDLELIKETPLPSQPILCENCERRHMDDGNPCVKVIGEYVIRNSVHIKYKCDYCGHEFSRKKPVPHNLNIVKDAETSEFYNFNSLNATLTFGTSTKRWKKYVENRPISFQQVFMLHILQPIGLYMLTELSGDDGSLWEGRKKYIDKDLDNLDKLLK